MLYYFISILVPELRKGLLSLYVMRKRDLEEIGQQHLKRKLFVICDSISIGDWLVLYMVAKNTNQVTFSEVLMAIKPPNYKHYLDASDPENVEIENAYLMTKNSD